MRGALSETPPCVQWQLGQDNGAEYKNGMVVCAYPDAAKVGLDILKKGGNAVDAAVAVQFYHRQRPKERFFFAR